MTKSTMGLERLCTNLRRHPVDTDCLNYTRPLWNIQHRFSPSYMYVLFVLPFLTEWPKIRVWNYTQTADTLYRNSRHAVSKKVSKVEGIHTELHTLVETLLFGPAARKLKTNYIKESNTTLCNSLNLFIYFMSNDRLSFFLSFLGFEDPT